MRLGSTMDIQQKKKKKSRKNRIKNYTGSSLHRIRMNKTLYRHSIVHMPLTASERVDQQHKTQSP